MPEAWVDLEHENDAPSGGFGFAQPPRYVLKGGGSPDSVQETRYSSVIIPDAWVDVEH